MSNERVTIEWMIDKLDEIGKADNLKVYDWLATNDLENDYMRMTVINQIRFKDIYDSV